MYNLGSAHMVNSAFEINFKAQQTETLRRADLHNCQWMEQPMKPYETSQEIIINTLAFQQNR
jgi:hypothetical protein